MPEMTDRPIRVLHVTRLPITVTAFLLPLLREHAARGEHASVACGDGPEAERIEAEGFEVHRFRLRRNVWPWNLAVALWDLSRIVRRERIDWVFTHTPIASGIARLAARIGGAAGTIYMAHGLPCAPRTPRLTWLLWYGLERLFGLLTDGLITMNRYDHELARRHGFIRWRDNILQVNGVGVDAERFAHLSGEVDAAAVKQELGLPADEPMVLMLAWTLPTKGIREFLEASRRLAEEGVPGRFVLAGHGPLDEEIAAFITRHGLQERVFHLGWRRDAPRLLVACDIFVLPTYYPEGMPVSILEAMACGKPVVATHHRGCEDEVEDGVTGLLVEPQDPVAVAEDIRTLIEDPDRRRRLGQAGLRRVNEKYRIEKATQAIIAAFDRIVRGHAGR
jgi:glycosyltransferase EpsD